MWKLNRKKGDLNRSPLSLNLDKQSYFSTTLFIPIEMASSFKGINL